jgi:hypothetical protein
VFVCRESRDNPVTVREAMRVLETHICLDASGSKSRFYKYFNIAKISQSYEKSPGGLERAC